MRFRTTEVLFGMLLAVAIFAMGMLFSSTYHLSPFANSQLAEPAAQTGHASKAIATDDAKAGGEFWSAKLTDWLLAAFTLFLVVFTAALVGSTNKLWKASREDFIATHRPRVILRYIQGPEHDEDGLQIIWLTFVNIGANEAVIDAFGGDLAYRGGYNEQWGPPGLDADLKDVQPVTLACGQRHVFTVTAKISANTDQALFSSVWPGFQVCAVGIIRYRDRNGISRHTGFFRVLDDSGERFVVSEHESEMEYQD